MIRLIVLARAPITGKCKTRLAEGVGPQNALRIYRAMLLDTLERFEPLGHDSLLLATPEDDGERILRDLAPRGWAVEAQAGESFEARLIDAWRRGAAGGAYPVLMGTDAPHIDLDSLSNGLRTLDTQPDSVLMGPARDGGYYVIGASRSEPDLLRNMPWSTPEVARETAGRCAELGLTLHRLPESFDVDTEQELRELSQLLAKDPGLAPRTAEVLSTNQWR